MTLGKLFKSKFLREWIAANTLAGIIIYGIVYLSDYLFLGAIWVPIELVFFVASFNSYNF
jgi:hypothetical protein